MSRILTYDVVRGRRIAGWRWLSGRVTAIACLSALAVSWFILSVLSGLPDDDALRNVGTMAQATVAFDRHDRAAFTISREQRIEVPLDRMSPHIVHAVLTVEDQRFYDHAGIDVIRIAGAALANLRLGRAAQGGSTLTQQLARQAFLTPERTLRRKLREIVLAARLERTFTKPEILEIYLNKVYFGDGLYGVEAASMGVFGKHAADLDVPEAALLAGLVQAPSALAPREHLDLAVTRRNLVLGLMRDTGTIDDATYRAARDSSVRLDDSFDRAGDSGRYFKEEVRKELVERFGAERVYTGGLRVYTSLDPGMQRAAEREVARTLATIERRQNRSGQSEADDPLQAALLALDPVTGAVRVMVGGRDFGRSHFNRATQARRQPGSAFKPIVYATALEQGYTASTLISDLSEPIEISGGEWLPADGYADTDAMTMRSALQVSSNRAAVHMLQTVGIPHVLDYAQRLGIGSQAAVPSLALGSSEVTLLSMTRAFAAFANGGIVTRPTLIRRVESADGQLLYEAARDETRAISTATAFILTSMLANVVDAGTGRQARAVGFAKPAAGKTGTTNDRRDAWFVGYTPHLATGVWIGHDRPHPIAARGSAAELAVPLWGRFMMTATEDDPPDGFAVPDAVEPARICRLSGLLANDACRHAKIADEHANGSGESMVYTEYFATGTAPVSYCPLHRGWSILDLFARGGHTASPGAAPPISVPGMTDGATAGRSSAGPNVVKPRPEEQTEALPARRGFWARLFGIGKSDTSGRNTEPPKKTPTPATPATLLP